MCTICYNKSTTVTFGTHGKNLIQNNFAISNFQVFVKEINPVFAYVGFPVPALQQKNAMQNSLKKLQQEMAALEAVLKQNGSQNCEGLPVPRELPHSKTEGASEMEQKREENNRLIVLFGLLGFLMFISEFLF